MPQVFILSVLRNEAGFLNPETIDVTVFLCTVEKLFMNTQGVQNQHKSSMQQTLCALCGGADYTVVYRARLPEAIDAKAYAAWRDRDYLHYQFVRCNTCSLVRSNPILSEEMIRKLYEDTEFDHAEITDISASIDTYSAAFSYMVQTYGVRKDAFLEIGCGDGFFFSVPRALGFTSIRGVEPTASALKRAVPIDNACIIQDFFRSDLFKPESFDVIVFFQTLDHILNPNVFLQDCFRVLKPGGYVLAINHNERSFAARLFGESCPIFDIGHAYLYNLVTMRKIFEKNGFRVRESFPVRSVIFIKYCIHLLPLPVPIKNLLKKFAAITHIGNIKIRLYMGNLGCIAQKPSLS